MIVRSDSRPKRILVLRYSQTGQLTRIVDHLLQPLRENDRIEITEEILRPLPDYPYPWPFWRFIDTFPEAVYEVAPQLAPLSLTGDEDFDLIILPWQVWFLAPALPITAFLQQPLAARLLAGKPVISVIGCRNMWMMAFAKLQNRLNALGAHLIDNIVLTDPGPTLATLITTPRWLWTGHKNEFWGLPAAGVTETEMRRCRRFGRAIADALQLDAEKNNQAILTGLGAVTVDPHLIFSERTGTRSFRIWGQLLRAVGLPGQKRRLPFLMLYVVFLITLIISVMPISLLLQWLIRPLRQRTFMTQKIHFEQPSGSDTDRLSKYDY